MDKNYSAAIEEIKALADETDDVNLMLDKIEKMRGDLPDGTCWEEENAFATAALLGGLRVMCEKAEDREERLAELDAINESTDIIKKAASGRSLFRTAL